MASSGDVKLLGIWGSPFVLRVKIALTMKSVDYEYREESLDSKSDLLLKSNPVHKKVPVLVHGDLPISESLIILQYIDEVWSSGPRILPSDPYDRALARFWASYVDEKWYKIIRDILLSDGEEQQHKIGEAKEAAAVMETAFIATSKGERFFNGQEIGFVDIAIGSFLPWFEVLEKLFGTAVIEQTGTPNLFKWAQDFSSHAALKDYVPEIEKRIEHAKHLIAKYKVK